MKFMLKMYRLFKPVAIYTSYLFTMLTLLYLTGHTVFPKVLVLKAGILWGIFFFSLGSILAQRVLLGSGFLSSVPYKVRCFLYLCAVGMHPCWTHPICVPSVSNRTARTLPVPASTAMKNGSDI